jgi:predicted nucleic acid-binding protein
MKTLIDTPVWSFLLRRDPASLSAAESAVLRRWLELARDDDIVLIGVVRQEILSGLRMEVGFNRLRAALFDFIDEPATTADHQRAAQMSNICRWEGVRGSPTDFLICAMAERLEAAILTTDHDFEHFARHLPLRIEVA